MGPEQPASEPVFSDKEFVKKAAEEKLTEVELGKLAQEKGSSPAVKEFGKRIVEDHSKNDQSLASAASKVNVDVPTELPRGGKKAVEKLSKLSGPDFDRAYAKLMLNDQKSNVESFSEEARLGKIPEVKNFAEKTLPTLQEHRQMAEQLETSVKKYAYSGLNPARSDAFCASRFFMNVFKTKPVPEILSHHHGDAGVDADYVRVVPVLSAG